MSVLLAGTNMASNQMFYKFCVVHVELQGANYNSVV